MPLSLQPYRLVLQWQAIATFALAAVAGLLAGGHAALSALLGGVVSLSASAVYAFVLALSRPTTAGGTLVTMFRAEASKILVILGEFWLVLATYKDVVLAAFFLAFVVTVLLNRMALLDRNS